MFNLFKRRRIERAMRIVIGHSETDAHQQVSYPLFDFHVQSLDDVQSVGEGVLRYAATIAKRHTGLFGIRVVSDDAESDLIGTAIKLLELHSVMLKTGGDWNLMPVIIDRNIFGFELQITTMPD